MENSFLTIMGPALCAVLLVAATHVPLGQEVLKRGIIFIDLAIAQLAALGAVIIQTLLHDASILTVQAASLVCALAGAAFFSRRHDHPEAVIGATFVVASSVALLVLSSQPHGHEGVGAMLAGQVLWVTPKQLIYTALLYGAVLCFWFTNPNRERWFYYVFAVTVTASVQLVGVYLVFASLVLPALATKQLRAAYILSALAALGGIGASLLLDLPTGPTLVCSLALFCMMMHLRKTIEAG